MKEYFNEKNKKCGSLNEGIYRKEVNSKKHKLRIMNAYGISSSIVKDLQKENCKEIRIREKDTKKILSILFDEFLSNSVERDFVEKQHFVSVKFFKID